MKKDWLDAVTTDAVRDFFTKNLVEEHNYVMKVNLIKSETSNNVYEIMCRNPFTKEISVEYYDAFGKVYKNPKDGNFVSAYNPKDGFDDTIGAWFTLVSSANHGRNIDDRFFSQDFEGYYNCKIESYFSPIILRYKDIIRQYQTILDSYISSHETSLQGLNELLNTNFEFYTNENEFDSIGSSFIPKGKNKTMGDD